MTSLITVTIGRNVGTLPMPRNEWDEFRNQVKTSLFQDGGATQVFGPFDGQGSWTDADGELIVEDSSTFTALTDRRGFADELGAQLSDLALLYGQDAIAYSIGEAQLAVAPAYA